MERKREEIIEAICGEIARRSISVGEKLPSERDMAADLKISRNLLREALVALEVMGIIEIRERQGARLLRRTDGMPELPDFTKMVLWPRDSLRQLMEIREIVEVPAARLAAQRRNSQDLERIRRCIEELAVIEERGERQQGDGAHWDSLLHWAVVQASGNQILHRIYEGIQDLLVRYIGESRARFFSKAFPTLAQEAWQDHQGLLQALEAQDPEGAARIMTSHLELAWGWFVAQEELTKH